MIVYRCNKSACRVETYIASLDHVSLVSCPGCQLVGVQNVGSQAASEKVMAQAPFKPPCPPECGPMEHVVGCINDETF